MDLIRTIAANNNTEPAIALVTKGSSNVFAFIDKQDKKVPNCMHRPPGEDCIFVQAAGTPENCCRISQDPNYRHLVLMILELIPREYRSIQVLWTLHQLLRFKRLQTSEDSLGKRFEDWTDRLLWGGDDDLNSDHDDYDEQAVEGGPYLKAQLSEWFFKLWPYVLQVVDTVAEEPLRLEIVLHGDDTEANNAVLGQLLSVYQQRPVHCHIKLQLIVRGASFTLAAFDGVRPSLWGSSKNSVLSLTSSKNDHEMPLQFRTEKDALAPCFRVSWRSLLSFVAYHCIHINITSNAPLHKCLYLDGDSERAECEYFTQVIMPEWSAVEVELLSDMTAVYLGRRYEWLGHVNTPASLNVPPEFTALNTADINFSRRLRNIVDPVNWTAAVPPTVDFIVDIDETPDPNWPSDETTDVYVRAHDNRQNNNNEEVWCMHLVLKNYVHGDVIDGDEQSEGLFQHTLKINMGTISTVHTERDLQAEWHFVESDHLNNLNIICTENTITGRLVYCSRDMFRFTTAATNGNLRL